MKAVYAENEKSRYKIDMRQRRDLLGQIEALAQSYTPEWKFDLKRPDAASVIGIIFAGQMAESINRINQVMRHYHIEFANMCETALRPARPSGTVCTLKINENMQSGVSLKRGTQVIGLNDDGDEVTFAFQNDVYVTNAQIIDMIGASGSAKKVIAYPAQKIPVFSYHSHQGQLLRRQALVMDFGRLPCLQEDGIRLKFHGNFPSEKLSALFSDAAGFSFSFLSEGGTIPVEEVKCDQDTVWLKHSGSIPAVGTEDEKRPAIVLEMVAPVERTIELDGVELLMAGRETDPEFIWNGRSELSGSSFLPFTQQFSMYQEFYIGQSFCMEQRGAAITLKFSLHFGTYSPGEQGIYEKDLRMIRRKPKENYQKPHYNCWIQEVAFDYFNGKGWKRLETEFDIAAVFAKEENAGEYEIRFNVPYDWEPVMQGGYEGNCIRMQIVRADCCYMQDATFYYPVISDLKVCLEERDRGTVPGAVKRIYGSDTSDVTGDVLAGRLFEAFTQLPYAGDYLFLGFDRYPGTGPVSLFAELDQPRRLPELKLAFAYSCESGFNPLRVIDGTDGLQNSGILTFMPPEDMAAYDIEGVKRYWLRIEDTGRYFAEYQDSVPVLENIYINAVRTENIIACEEQDYYINTVTAGMRFPLYAENILSAEVWVNEKEQLSVEEMDRFLKRKDIMTRVEYNVLGEIEEFYILWHEVESFEAAGAHERCYSLDRSTNEICFGDGIHVEIPCNTNSIAFKVKALCCNGAGANVKAYAIDRFRSSIITVGEVTNPVNAYGGSNTEDTGSALKRAGAVFSSRRRMVSERDYIKEALLFSDMIEQAACVTDCSAINIVLLMKDYGQGGYSFRNVRQKLQEHFLDCCELTCRPSDISILEPVFVHISIDLWLDLPDYAKGMELRQRWKEKIEQYLEPVKQKGGAGWKIGRLPDMRQIRLMLSMLEKDTRIEKMNVLASYTEGRKRYEMHLSRIERNPFMICCNGNHHICINER